MYTIFLIVQLDQSFRRIGLCRCDTEIAARRVQGLIYFSPGVPSIAHAQTPPALYLNGGNVLSRHLLYHCQMMEGWSLEHETQVYRSPDLLGHSCAKVTDVVIESAFY